MVVMRQSDKGILGVGVFSLGGVLLFFIFYLILENAGKPWINDWFLFMFVVLPFGLIAFFLVGLGLLLMMRSGERRDKS